MAPRRSCSNPLVVECNVSLVCAVCVCFNVPLVCSSPLKASSSSFHILAQGAYFTPDIRVGLGPTCSKSTENFSVHAF